MSRILTVLLIATLMAGCGAGEYSEPPVLDLSDARRWVGADYMPMPLHDWSRAGDVLISRPASYGGAWRNFQSRLYFARQDIGASGDFTLTVTLRDHLTEASREAHGRGGVWLGLQSETPSPQNVWLYPAENPLFIGINAQGRLQVNNTVDKARIGRGADITLHISGALGQRQDTLRVEARSSDGQRLTLERELPAGTLRGAVSLVAQGRDKTWSFRDLSLSGSALVDHPDRSIGPILWTQYTLQDTGTLKLLAQMVPLEATDARDAQLQLKTDGEWQAVATAELEPLSSTFVFEVPDVFAETAMDYRVLYAGPDGEAAWAGHIRRNPAEDETFTLGVFNCNHGDLFLNTTLVENVKTQDPDMLFFAGDQIYEEMDRISVIREPLEGARLSYLGKYTLFGLEWRELLRDRPSVIIPDDHDVFMGNVWGDNGRGYSMAPAWVNMVQRTQTGSLPDPVDPAPVERGIEVYFTALDYAGMSFAIIEDRKFKSPPQIARGRPNFPPEPLLALDVPGAQLLGERQLEFLTRWAAQTQDKSARWFLSQSMFAKANTHTGNQLERFYRDMDANGWPQSARNRALRALPRDTIMVHGDQHLGMLARMGIDTWEDGPLAFMVTGSAVGFPRAWWPERAPANGLLNGPYTGRYIDDMGNRLTVLGVTNPAPLPPGGNALTRPDYASGSMFEVQAAKGAGHGLIVVDKTRGEARFEAYRLDFDAARPAGSDQFEGFPITVPLQ